MKEIRIHGRGGQGAAKGAEILTLAFVYDDKYACSFPMYGAARRGGNVSAFCRYDDIPVREKTKIYEPDCLIVTDESLLIDPRVNVFNGVKGDGILILNTDKTTLERPQRSINRLGLIDANKIAIEEIGILAVNTVMLASFAAATKWVSLDSIEEAFEEYFKGLALAKNIKCARRSYIETKIIGY